VEALLRAVNTTNDFENELAARFGDATPAEVRKARAQLRRAGTRGFCHQIRSLMSQLHLQRPHIAYVHLWQPPAYGSNRLPSGVEGHRAAGGSE
jgi:hypothetical protein